MPGPRNAGPTTSRRRCVGPAVQVIPGLVSFHWMEFVAPERSASVESGRGPKLRVGGPEMELGHFGAIQRGSAVAAWGESCKSSHGGVWWSTCSGP